MKTSANCLRHNALIETIVGAIGMIYEADLNLMYSHLHILIYYLDHRYEADHVYALNTVYFLCAVIGVFTISNILVRFAPEWLKRTRIWRTTTSASRYLAYRGYRLPALRYWSPSLGVILLGLAGAVFFLGMWDAYRATRCCPPTLIDKMLIDYPQQ